MNSTEKRQAGYCDQSMTDFFRRDRKKVCFNENHFEKFYRFKKIKIKIT